MTPIAIQDRYPEAYSHCYGCGRLNERGLQIKSFVDGEEVVATFTPREHHIAVPGYVYGGLIASLLDCHSIATAAAAAHRARGGNVEREPMPRFVTAALHVDFLKPTPLGVPLTIRARAKEVKGRKVVVEASVSANNDVYARGEIVAVELPDAMVADGPGS